MANKTKIRIYLDTSVFSAYYDDKVPDRQLGTQEFWKKSAEFEISTSELAKEELGQTPDKRLRQKLEALLKDLHLIAVTEKMRRLAQSYVEAGIFTPIMLNDAIHVAAAVMSRQSILLSWNFKHLVNRRRRAMVNELNHSKGLPAIEIIAPPEV